MWGKLLVKKLILIAVLVLVGAGVFFSLKKNKQTPTASKVEKKNDVPTIDLSLDEKLSDLKPADPKDRVFRMFAYNSSVKVKVSDFDKKTGLDNLRQVGLNLSVESKETTDPLSKSELSKWDYDIGVSSIIHYGELLLSGKELTPVFEVTSGIPKESCTWHVNVIAPTDSAIKNFKDLAGKNVAIRYLSRNTGFMATQALIDENVKMKTIHIGVDGEWIKNGIASKTIEAIVEPFRVHEKYQESDTLGRIVDNKLADYPQLKLVESKKINVPCRLMYLNSSLAESERITIVNTVRKIGLQENGPALFWPLGAFSHVSELALSQGERLNKMITTYGVREKTPKDQLAEEIIPH